MLHVGRDRLIDAGIIDRLSYIQANAQNLPFKDHFFDCIIIGFGLRNVTDKKEALASMFRTIKPGGKIIILEFSKPVLPGLKPIYDAYSFYLMPLLGKIFANDERSYRYLVESIRMHPDQDELKLLIEDVGFEDCRYKNLCGGIVAIHSAYKY